MRVVKLIVDAGEKRERLDHLVSRRLRSVSRTQVQQLIKAGHVLWEGEALTRQARHIPGPGVLEVRLPYGDGSERFVLTAEDVLHEDNHLIAVNKPAGYPTRGRLALGDNDVYEAVRRWIGDSEMPLGMPHRLDRETSGVLVFGKHKQATAEIQKAFQGGAIHKAYLAWIEGKPRKRTGRIDAPVHAPGRVLPRVDPEGKPAVTWYRVLQTCDDSSLVLAHPETGRTHQLRLHFAHLGHPILGDSVYGTAPADRCQLHAVRMAMVHPFTPSKLLLTAPCPSDFLRVSEVRR